MTIFIRGETFTLQSRILASVNRAAPGNEYTNLTQSQGGTNGVVKTEIVANGSGGLGGIETEGDNVFRFSGGTATDGVLQGVILTGYTDWEYKSSAVDFVAFSGLFLTGSGSKTVRFTFSSVFSNNDGTAGGPNQTNMSTERIPEPFGAAYDIYRFSNPASSSYWSNLNFDTATLYNAIGAYSAGNFAPLDNLLAGETYDFLGSGSVKGGNFADTLISDGNFVNIDGGDGNDTITGGGSGDILIGGSGNDLISGQGGADSIAGGLGNDTLNGGDGNDTLTGGGGIDFFNGGMGANRIEGGNGTNYLVTGDGADTYIDSTGYDVLVISNPSQIDYSTVIFTGDIANDAYNQFVWEQIEGSSGGDYIAADYRITKPMVINGNAGGDIIGGSGGNDTLLGGTGTDEMYGNGGNDSIFGEADNDTLFGQDGSDTLDGGAGNDSLNGGNDSDLLLGGAGNDTLQGDIDFLVGIGNDTFVGGTGNDRFVSAAGRDVADYTTETRDGFGWTFQLSIAQATAQHVTFAAPFFFTEIDTLIGLTDVIGSPNSDTFFAGGGSSSIFSANGGSGYDDLWASPTTIVGYDQNFQEVTGSASNTITLTGAGTGFLTTPSFYLFSPVTSRFDFTSMEEIHGNVGNDTINGSSSSDSLFGDADSDSLSGNGGNDTLNGGTGADALNGGNGWDTASYANAAATVQVVMYNAAYNTGEAAGDTFSGIEAVQGSANIDVLVGDFLTNALLGGAGGDWLDGTYGGDYLYGEAGNDSLVSRLQADVLDGGADFDYARYDYADAGLRAYLYDTTQNSGWAAGDTFVSIEGLAGSYFADDLRGDASQNIIYGLGGGDYIIGLGGSDLLIGGDGQDLFHFVGIGDGGSGGDAIQDFVSGQDRISVTGQFFGLGSPGGVAIDSYRFVAGTAANLATSQFIYNGATRQLFYDQDGTGAGAQVLLATLQAGAVMTAGDILVL
jgi:Ca2+-binding RTX toxin-like protein